MKIVRIQNYGEFSEESFEKKIGVIRGHPKIWYECECLATRAGLFNALQFIPPNVGEEKKNAAARG